MYELQNRFDPLLFIQPDFISFHTEARTSNFFPHQTDFISHFLLGYWYMYCDSKPAITPICPVQINVAVAAAFFSRFFSLFAFYMVFFPLLKFLRNETIFPSRLFDIKFMEKTRALAKKKKRTEMDCIRILSIFCLVIFSFFLFFYSR